MTTVGTMSYAPEEVEHASSKWWVLLITGIAWILVSILVLDSDLDSALTIGYLCAGYFFVAGVMEFAMIGIVEGWKWVHATLGVLFVIGGIAALMEPFRTYMLLASLVGFFLVVKGTLDFVMALATRHESDLWWMLLISGIIEVLFGFWASGYPGRSSALLLLWIGIGALIRGVTQLVLAFQVRKIHEEVV